MIGGIEDIDRKEILTKISTILYDDQKSDLDDLDTNRSQHEPNHKSKIPPESKPNIDLMKIKSSSLYQIPIPEHIKKYESLYKYLASKDMIPLGILRGINPITKMGPRYNKSPYVVTNPSKATELFAFDRVFVLSPVPRHTARTSQYLVRDDCLLLIYLLVVYTARTDFEFRDICSVDEYSCYLDSFVISHGSLLSLTRRIVVHAHLVCKADETSPLTIFDSCSINSIF